jgi:hypothetical protein
MSKYITNQIMEEAIKALQELVAQPSYNQSPAPKAPSVRASTWPLTK